MRPRTVLRLAATAALLACSVVANPSRGEEGEPRPKLDVIYLPTPRAVVDRMLEAADLKAGDVLYDLGCGDGRIVVTAARRYGVKAVGFDIDPERVRESRANAREAGVEDRVTIRRQDLFTADLSGASVVTLYLLPNLNARLLPKLAKLKPGSRVVCHSFDLRGVKPKRVEKVEVEKGGFRMIYVYEVPWERDTGR